MDRSTCSVIMQAMNTVMLFAIFWIFYLGGVVVMAALDMEMAARVHERLARMDEAIELMQDLRKETSELFAELFPGVI